MGETYMRGRGRPHHGMARTLGHRWPGVTRPEPVGREGPGCSPGFSVGQAGPSAQRSACLKAGWGSTALQGELGYSQVWTW